MVLSDSVSNWSRAVLMGLAVVTVLAASATWGPAEPRVIELPVRAGALPAEQRLIRVQQGDDVTLRWTTDAPLTVHLHGYDIERRIRPDAPATMRFTARATGRFPITVHGHGNAPEKTLTRPSGWPSTRGGGGCSSAGAS
jgi:FtsP/CotA-like multicopper oxidase with cupredoxin domain